jgi:polyisoprenoid-binding protein YceI
MKRIFLILFIVFLACSQTEESIEVNEEIVTEGESATSTTENIALDETTTTITIEQLNSFEEEHYVIDKERSKVSYLAPKQFLNSGLEIVEGVTSEIIGEFTLSLIECESSNSCLIISNLLIRVDLSTLKSDSSLRDNSIKTQWLESKIFPEATFKIENLELSNKDFDSLVEDSIVGQLSIREIVIDTPFSLTAYYSNEEIHISGYTEIDTTWFGFDPPTKFNAWEVLNPIGITVDLIAVKKNS